MVWTHGDLFIQSPILIGNIKAQFSIGNIKTQFPLAMSKLNSHWQHQNPILIDNIKSPTYIGTIKNPSLLLGIIYRKPKVINTWQNTIS